MVELKVTQKTIRNSEEVIRLGTGKRKGFLSFEQL